MKSRILSMFVLFVLTLGIGANNAFKPCCAYAEEENSKLVETVNKAIESLPDAIKKSIDFSKMNTEQKISYLLEKAEPDLKDYISGKFQDRMKEKLLELAKQQIRAKQFIEIAVPQIQNAYALGKPFDWSKINAEVASKVDTWMNGVSAGIEAAKIGWGAYEAYSKGDTKDALMFISGEIGDKLASSFIPGYGYMKVGKEIVVALGEYVLDYATDTAVQGMLERFYNYKSDPDAFAKWLINKSPADLRRDVKDKFDSGEAFGFLFRGQGTDKSDEAMQNRLLGELISMRGMLLLKKKEQERRALQVQRDIERALAPYKEAQNELERVASQAKKELEEGLAPVKQFKEERFKAQAKDVAAEAQKLEQQIGEVGSAGGLELEEIPVDDLIEEFKDIYALVKDSSEGYSYDEISTLAGEYEKKKYKIIKEIEASNEDNYQQVVKRIEESFRPREEELSSAYQRCDSNTCKNQVVEQMQQLAAQKEAKLGPVRKAMEKNREKIALQKQVLKNKETIVKLEAQAREEKLFERYKTEMEKFDDMLKQANRDLSDALAALNSEISSTLHFPQYFAHPDAQIATGDSLAKEAREGKLEASSFGYVRGYVDRLQDTMEKLKEDLNNYRQFINKKTSIIAKWQADVSNIKHRFESSIPEKMRRISSDYPVRENAQEWESKVVEQYGSSAAPPERLCAWGGVFNAYDYCTEEVIQPPDRFFNKQLQEIYQQGELIAKFYREKIKTLEGQISELDYYAGLDDMAKKIVKLSNNLYEIIGPALSNLRFEQKEEQVFEDALADAEKRIKDLQDLWEKFQPDIERLRKVINAYQGAKNAIRYYSTAKDNLEKGLKTADVIFSVPSRISAFKDEIQRHIQYYETGQKGRETFIRNVQEKYTELLREERIEVFLKELQYLMKSLDLALENSAKNLKYPEDKAYYDELTKLKEEIKNSSDQRLKEIRHKLEEKNRRIEQEEARKKAEADQRAREENEDRIKRTNPSLYYGYKIRNQRINTYPINSTAPEIIITKDKLDLGKISLTAQLNHIDKAKTMLISVDSGMTWKELPLSPQIEYSFMPLPNIKYRPYLKIKTIDLIDVVLPILENQTIIYQDKDFKEQVLESVKGLADAYERKDIGGFLSLVSRGFLGDRTALENGLRTDFDLFTDIRLKIYINRVDQRGTMFAVETRWDKTQTPIKTGAQQKTSGKTTMFFVLEDGALKLKNLRGNLIYATLSPDIALTSGLPQTTVDEIRDAYERREPEQPGAENTDGGQTQPAVVSPLLTVVTKTFVSPNFPGIGFDFTAGTTVPAASANSDIDFESNSFFADNAQQSAQAFHQITEAPSAGYNNAGGSLNAGNVYVFITKEGYYAKMEIVSSSDRGTGAYDVQIRYAVQTDGTRDLRTQ